MIGYGGNIDIKNIYLHCIANTTKTSWDIADASACMIHAF